MISFSIKEYFEKSGGIDILGYPVPGLHFASGSFVQYFQRQRLVESRRSERQQSSPESSWTRRTRPKLCGGFQMAYPQAKRLVWHAAQGANAYTRAVCDSHPIRRQRGIESPGARAIPPNRCHRTAVR